MSRIANKDGSISSTSNGLFMSNSSHSLLNDNGHAYRRSPVPPNHQLASQTFGQPQSYDTLNSQSTGYNSEEVSEAVNSVDEDETNELKYKFEHLQRQVVKLTETQTSHEERYRRSKQENEALLTRVHGLEDQLRDLELSSEARIKEDEKRLKETMAKQSLQQSQECEKHLHANFQLQEELYRVKSDLLKSDALIKTLRSEKEALANDLQDKNNELNELDEEIHKLKLHIKRLKEEESVKTSLINILNEELEDSQNRSQHKANHVANNTNDQSSLASRSESSPKQMYTSSRRSSQTSGFQDDILSPNSKNQRDIDAMEMGLNKLREENRRLKEINEELQAQIFNAQLEEGRSMIQECNKSFSLADEISDMDKDKLIKTLRDDYSRLKNYTEMILLKVMEKSPTILEASTIEAKGGP